MDDCLVVLMLMLLRGYQYVALHVLFSDAATEDGCVGTKGLHNPLCGRVSARLVEATAT